MKASGGSDQNVTVWKALTFNLFISDVLKQFGQKRDLVPLNLSLIQSTCSSKVRGQCLHGWIACSQIGGWRNSDHFLLSASQMSNISEDEWRDTMTKIFEKLEVHQFRKMKELLNKSGYDSPTKVTTKFKMELPKNLIQRFGAEESIRLVNEAMKEIPRNDAGVQDLLRPFMDKLKKQEEGELPVNVVCIMVKTDQ